jgi:hypothetical protein
MKDGKVLCPYCKGKKKEVFDLYGITMERTCLSCDDNGMVWWIDKILHTEEVGEYPWGYISEGVKGQDYGKYILNRRSRNMSLKKEQKKNESKREEKVGKKGKAV